MEEIELSHFADDTIVYVENTKKSTPQKSFLELTRELSKVAGHKINVQQSAALLQASNKHVYPEIKYNVVYNC